MKQDFICFMLSIYNLFYCYRFIVNKYIFKIEHFIFILTCIYIFYVTLII